MKRKLHILAVDDEPAINESVSYALDAPHRKIIVAKDGHDALAKAANEKFDVVITDHRMPRSGGLELVRKLRQGNYDGRIVVLSAHLSPENIGTYEELAVDEIVAKPFDFEELRDIITSLEDEIEF
jgi:DNA-binding response OmpR family regulator